MIFSKWFDKRLPSLTVEHIRRYMLDHGWRLQLDPGPKLLVFEGPLDDYAQPIIQILPSSEAYKDYPVRREDLLRALSIIEDRYMSDIVDEMLSPANGAVPQEVENPARVS